MPKFPNPPSVEVLRRVEPETRKLPKGTRLARVYFTGGEHPTRWDEFRHYGPTNARFDHHLRDAQGQSSVQERSIFYCATRADTCLAETFQETRRINRTRNGAWLVVFVLQRELELLDLTGTYPTRAGASMAINSGNRGRAREWAKKFYEAYVELPGICYASSMHGNEPAIALMDRAEKSRYLPEHPDFNRALADDALLDVLKHSANRFGYGLL